MAAWRCGCTCSTPGIGAVVSALQGARVEVVGAGVVGLCVALELRRRGAEVLLIDEDRGPNASLVAAGMIAPAFEAVLDDPHPGRLPLLRFARDLWPELADGRVVVRREGAMVAVRSDADLARVLGAARREGVLCEVLSAAAARARQPRLSPELAGAVFSPEDWRVEAAGALRVLAQTFADLGGRRRTGRIHGPRHAAPESRADVRVICAGWGSRALATLAPELEHLRPIKGQLIRFPGAEPREGAAVRDAQGGYLVPSTAGVLVGASMEEGRYDPVPSQEVQDGLRGEAARLMPHLADLPAIGAVGVRAATPDGLPLVGRSRSGAMLATGFRRNGWLLAPLAARIVAEQLAGESPGPWAEAMRPGRFDPTA